MKITVGIPAYNEEENIAKIISQLKDITSSIIVCDDHSTDDTNKIANSLGADVVTHSKNMGYGSAIKSIFAKAKEIDSDILVTFDADGQHQVQNIKKVIEPILKNKADIVIGSRFLEKKIENLKKMKKFKKFQGAPLWRVRDPILEGPGPPLGGSGTPFWRVRDPIL